MLSAPYNFVPLSRKVFFPDWADQVSHDVPFKDGLSGEIDCQLVFDSPVYVRNGGPWDAEAVRETPAAQAFFSVGNTVLIPGSSLRGVFRSVLEIASFGKMSRADDHRYGVRDLQNRPLYTDRMTETVGRNTYRPRVKAGWLKKNDAGDWCIVPCKFARVEQSDLRRLVPRADLNRRQDAPAKYEQWGERLDVSFELEPGKRHPHRRGAITLEYEKVSGASLRFGGPGTLVFTGQPSPNKHMEFVFYDADSERTLPVSPRVKKDFKFIHSEPGTEEPNPMWGFWQKRMKAGASVPVFYLGNGVVESFGLALMYRLPYKYSIRQTIEHTSADHDASTPDMADLIFGFIPPKGENVEEGLKGRVWFSAAVAQPGTFKTMPLQTTVLGAPKPTFYPNYVDQTGNGGQYATYMDDNAHIRGWKRYPARNAFQTTLPAPPPRAGVRVQTKLIPLQAGVKFRFTTKFHNLRPEELGALVWTLTWGGKTELRHSFGMAKAAGYGQGRVSLLKACIYRPGNSQPLQWDEDEHRRAFVDLMQKDVTAKWAETVQVAELQAMANPQSLSREDQASRLRHMQLDGQNEFVDAKRRHKALDLHVPFSGTSDSVLFPAQPSAAASTTSTYDGCVLYLQDPGSSLIVAKLNGQEVGRAALEYGEKLKAALPADVLAKFKERKKLSPCSVEVEVVGSLHRIKRVTVN